MADDRLTLTFDGDTRGLVKAINNLTVGLKKLEGISTRVQEKMAQAAEQTARAQIKADTDRLKSLRQKISKERTARATEAVAEKKFQQEKVAGLAKIRAAEQATATQKERTATAKVAADSREAKAAEQTAQVKAKADAQTAVAAERTARVQIAASEKTKQAQLRLRAAQTRATAAFQRSQAKMANAAKKTDKLVVNPLGRARKAILDVRTALILLGGAAGGQQIIKFASDFEVSLANVSTLLEPASVAIGQYRKQLDELARTSPKELIDLTRGLYQTISAGIPAVEGAGGAFDVLKQAQRAAVAGLSTTEQAVNAFTTILNAYSESGLTATEVSDKLFQTVRKGRTVFPELAESIGRVATIGARAGVSLDELLAATVSLTKAGLSTDEAMTQLRRLILGLVKPSVEVREQFNSLGIDFGETALKAKGLSGILAEITEVTHGSTDAFAQLFPNVRALVGAVVLGGSGLKDFNRSIEFMRRATGATDAAYKKINKTFDTTFKIFKSRLQAVFINVGDRVLPKLGKALEDLGDTLEENQEQLGNLVEVFFSFTSTVAKFLLGHGKELLVFFATLASAALIGKIRLLFGLLVTQMGNFAAATSFAALAGKGLFASLLAGLKATSGAFAVFGIGLAATIVSAIFSALDRAETEALARAKEIEKFRQRREAARAEKDAKRLGFEGAEARQAATGQLLRDPARVVSTDVGAGAEVQAGDIFDLGTFFTADVVEEAQEAGEAFGLTFASAVDSVAARLIEQTNLLLNASINRLTRKVTETSSKLKSLQGQSEEELVPFNADLEAEANEEQQVTRGQYKALLRDREKGLRLQLKELEATRSTRREIVLERAEALKDAKLRKEEAASLFAQEKAAREEAERRSQAAKDELSSSQLAGRSEAVRRSRLSRLAKKAIADAEAAVALTEKEISALDRRTKREVEARRARGEGEEEIKRLQAEAGAERLALLDKQQKAVFGVLRAEKVRLEAEKRGLVEAAARRLKNARLAAQGKRIEKEEERRQAAASVAALQKEQEAEGDKATPDPKFLEETATKLGVAQAQLGAASKALGAFSAARARALEEEEENLKVQVGEIQQTSALVGLQEQLAVLTSKRRKEEEAILSLAKEIGLVETQRALEAAQDLPALVVDLPEAPLEEFTASLMDGGSSAAMDVLRERIGDSASAVQALHAALEDVDAGVIRIGGAGEAVQSFADAWDSVVDTSEMAAEAFRLIREGQTEAAHELLAEIKEIEAVNEAFLQAVPEGEKFIPLEVEPVLPEGTTAEFLEELFRDAGVDLTLALTPEVFQEETLGDKFAQRLGIALTTHEQALGVTVGQKIQKAFREAGEEFLLDMASVIPDIATAVAEAFGEAASSGDVLGGLQSAFSGALSGVMAPLKELGQNIIKVPGEFGDAAKGAIGGILDAATELATAAISKISEVVLGPIQKAISAPLSLLFGSFGSAVDALIDPSNLESVFEEQREEAQEEHQARLNDLSQERQRRMQESLGDRQASRDAVRDYQKAFQEEQLRFRAQLREIDRDQDESQPQTVLQAQLAKADGVLNRVTDELPSLLEQFFVELDARAENFIKNLAAALEETFERGSEKFGDVIRTSESGVQILVDTLLKIIDTYGADFWQTLIEDSLSHIPGLIVNIIHGIVSLILGLIKGITRGAPKFIENAVDYLIDALVGLIRMIVEWAVDQIVTDFQNFFSQDFWWGLLETLWGLIKALLWELPQALDAIIMDLVPQLLNGIGKAIQEGAEWLWDKITKGSQAVGEFFNEDVPNAFDRLEAWFDQDFAGTEEGTTESQAAKAGAVTGDPATVAVSYVAGKAAEFFGWKKRHSGGTIGADGRNPGGAAIAASAGAQRFAEGGTVLDLVRGEDGKNIGKDDVPAILQVGEGVLNRMAMFKLGGSAMLQRLNDGEAPEKVFGRNLREGGSIRMGGMTIPDLSAATRSTLQRSSGPSAEAMSNIGAPRAPRASTSSSADSAMSASGPPVQATVSIKPSGNAVMDALANMLLQSAAVSMTTPGGLLRAAQARGTLPGTKNVRGRD